MLINYGSIESEYVNLYSLIDRKIRIPIFQRFYDWKTKEIVQFKEDLISAINKRDMHFYLLDFIYYEEIEESRSSSNTNRVICLADGQQRLITVNNLIKAIKDVAIEESLEIEDLKLFDISYDISEHNNKYIKHFTSSVVSPFKVIYFDLKKFVKENISLINEMVKVLKNNIYVFMKKCPNGDVAFDIFRQINTGGKPLTKDEVIKTSIDQYSKIYGVEFDTSNTKNLRQYLISYYKNINTDFDKKFDNMEIITFLKDHITKDRETFQKFIQTTNLFKMIEDSPIKRVINYINRNSLMDVVNILSMKNINVNTNHEYVRKLLLPLCMMSIVLTFNDGNPSLFKYLLNKVLNFIKENKNLDDINLELISIINDESSAWTITYDNFENKLGDSATQESIKKALLIIDIINSNMSGRLNVESINYEHVYPKKPCATWARNGWPTNTNDQKELINNIGNAFLLNGKINKVIQNKYISDKVTHYKTIIENDIFLLTTVNEMDFTRFENERENYIYERQKKIAKHIAKKFPLGPVLIKESN